MKKIVLLGLLMLCFVLQTSARTSVQMIGGGVTISNFNVEADDSLLWISFDAAIPKRAVKRGKQLIFYPVISDSSWKVAMTPVTVSSTGSKVINKRNAPTSCHAASALIATPNSTFRYWASTPKQRWMSLAQIIIESSVFGCCTSTGIHYDTIPCDLKLAELSEYFISDTAVTICYEENDFVPKTIGDSLAMTFSFVLPESRFDSVEPFKIYEEDKHNGLAVYFAQGVSTIDSRLRDNRQTLKNLVAAIDVILSSAESEVSHVVIGGFTSPEGRFEFNDRLAWERAISIKEHIITGTSMQPDKILVHNGSVDWRGLRSMVSGSNMQYRNEVLKVIDGTPLRTPEDHIIRLKGLKNIADGTAYNYMFENFFPHLRNGAFIKVYYKNKGE